MNEPGGERILASGRASDVILLDEHRVLRRIRGRGHHRREAELMGHARAAGYPVPEVLEVRADGLVMERVPGPTMGADLVRRPWRARVHARTLAELHTRLHGLRPPPDAPARYGDPEPDDAFLHGDLHPLNVILSPGGPVVIDWTNAGRGPAGADVADVWLVLGAVRLQAPAPLRALAAVLRRVFLAEVLVRAGRESAAAHLPTALAWRARDPHLSAADRRAMERLVRRETAATSTAPPRPG